MPDIRDTLKALSIEDAQMYAQSRTEMRRSYIATHAAVLGPTVWSGEDDQVLDLIDIQIAMLFMRAGRFDFEKGHVDIDRAKQLEDEIQERSRKLEQLKKGSSEGQRVLDQYAPRPNGRLRETGNDNANAENQLNKHVEELSGWKS